MNTSYQDIIRSFVDKYGLSRGQVIAEIEKTFSSMLSQWHRQNAVAMFSDDRLVALGYHENIGVVEQTLIELSTMRGWNTIKRILENNLSKAACLQKVAQYKRIEGEMRWGKIISQTSDGCFYVEIEIENESPVIAFCPANHVGVHERDELMVGQRRAFNLRRVEPIFLKNTPRIKVAVDRVSKILVEHLLLSQVEKRDVIIHCLSRYVGLKSFVESSAFLPKKAILAASRELNEHIQVKVIKTARGCRN
jgi:hypothetical protein